jgi:hypothetical protein
VRIVHRLLAPVLGVLLLGGNAGVCAGWAATPEARMACCAEGGNCPMHQGDARQAGSGHRLTQAQADGCCGASERDQSSPPTPTFVAPISSAVLGAGEVVPAISPDLVRTDGWRTAAPVPLAPVPRHVLFSVFLV